MLSANLHTNSDIDKICNYGKFKEKWDYNGETEEEFGKFRMTINPEKTKNMLGRSKEAEEIWDSIKGYLHS